MIRVTALLGLLGALGLALTWELSVPMRPVSNVPAITRSGMPPRTSPESRPGPLVDTSGTAGLTDLVASITARPLFSPTRRPADRAIEKPPLTAGADGLPRLSGVIVGPTGRRAIFAGTDGKALTAAEGDMVGPFKIRSIEPGVVSLSGPGGERALRPTFIATTDQKTSVPAVGNGPSRGGEGGQ